MRFPIDEKRKYVISMRKNGYTIREIVKELGMSSRDVEYIIKKNEIEEKEAGEREVIKKEDEEREILLSTKRSEALQLYKKGTSPLDVSIELKISAEEAKAFYTEYCSLQYPPHLLPIYDELNRTNSFSHFTNLFHLIRKKDLSIEEGVEAMEMINDISSLKEERRDLSSKVRDLENLQDFLKVENNSLKYQNEEMEKRLKSTLEKIDNGEKALGIINEILREKEKDLEKINSGEDYYKARKKVKLLVGEFLSSKTKVIALSVTSIITALQKDPDKQIIIDHILNPLKKKFQS